jgi:predicted nucleic acid-binding protein
MRIYFDACCLSRLTDDQTQSRIQQEAQAVERILQLIEENFATWIASQVLLEEVAGNRSEERRAAAQALLAMASETVKLNAAITRRAVQLQSAGYGTYDALHLATAEAADCQVLLSTDDAFIKRAARGVGKPGIPVRNPISWIKEQGFDHV